MLGTLVKTLTGQMGTTDPLMANPISFTGDSTYATGGTAAFQAKVQTLFEDHREIIGVIDTSIGTHEARYDKTADKLKVYVRTTGVEAANAADLSAVTFNLIVLSV